MYCHSRRDGFAYLIVNNSLTEATSVKLPGEAEVYVLSGGGDIRSPIAYLNGNPLTLNDRAGLPQMNGQRVEAGNFELAPGKIPRRELPGLAADEAAKGTAS